MALRRHYCGHLCLRKLPMKWYLREKVWSASELYRLGLINRLTAVGNHLGAAEELAQRILKAAPLAVRAEVRMNRYPLVSRRAEALHYSRSLT